MWSQQHRGQSGQDERVIIESLQQKIEDLEKALEDLQANSDKAATDAQAEKDKLVSDHAAEIRSLEATHGKEVLELKQKLSAYEVANTLNYQRHDESALALDEDDSQGQPGSPQLHNMSAARDSIQTEFDTIIATGKGLKDEYNKLLKEKTEVDQRWRQYASERLRIREQTREADKSDNKAVATIRSMQAAADQRAEVRDRVLERFQRPDLRHPSAPEFDEAVEKQMEAVKRRLYRRLPFLKPEEAEDPAPTGDGECTDVEDDAEEQDAQAREVREPSVIEVPRP